MKTKIIIIWCISVSIWLTGCSFNPFTCNNHSTGSPVAAALGAGIGAGFTSLFTSYKPLIVLGGIGGGMLGYYVTTLRYDSGGIIYACGEVYKVGQYVGIVIPTDNLFEANSAEFLPDAAPILDSAAATLARYPNNNVMVSGNTSGFSRTRWELKLSEKRAQKVSAYLWKAGVSCFRDKSTDNRKMTYVGYANLFPVASDLTNNGIRQNSRIQITSYPSATELMLDKRHQAYNNVGGACDQAMVEAPGCHGGVAGCGGCV